MNKKIKVALWGLGRAGWGMHIPEMELFPEMFEIIGSYDLIPERMKQVQSKYPNAKAYSSAEEMLADPEVELIPVAVRSAQHVDCDIRVLEAGKYCFAEKPVALNEAEVLRLKAASDKHPGKLFCRQNRRFEACFQHVQEIIKEGILGDIFEIKLCRHDYENRRDWQTLKSCSGGLLNNWGPHLIDQALQFIHAPLQSIWSDMRLISAMGDAEDHFKAILRGTNGIVVDIEVSGGVAIHSPIYAVYGKLGSMVSYDEQDLILKYVDTEKTPKLLPATDETPENNGNYGGNVPIVWKEETRKVAPKSGEDVNKIYRALYRTIREGVPFPVTVDQALEVVRVTQKIREAAYRL